MQFDLKSFLISPKKPYTARFLLQPTDWDFGGFSLTEPAACQFTAIQELDGALMTLQVKAKIQAECARCLDPVHQEYEFDRECTVKLRDLDDDVLELPLNDKGSLILEELAFQEILYEVPTVLLCSAECQGLCPICGKKKLDCSCPKAEQQPSPDARLSILKQLLS